MTTKIVELSAVIAEKTKVVDEYFKKNGLPTPSFDLDGPTRITIPPQEKEASDALTAVLSATRDLNQLLTGPTGVLMGTSVSRPAVVLLSVMLQLANRHSPTTVSVCKQCTASRSLRRCQLVKSGHSKTSPRRSV